jgi:hypothetical protein
MTEQLSLEEFKERVDAVLVEKDMTEQRWDRPLPSGRSYFSRDKAETPFDGLLVQWETGGVSGGSCWESSNPQPYTRDDPAPDLTALEAVLEDVCPSLTYLAFRRLERMVVEGEYTEREYYGNCTNYRYRGVELGKVYDFLVEEGLVAAPGPSCSSR